MIKFIMSICFESGKFKENTLLFVQCWWVQDFVPDLLFTITKDNYNHNCLVFNFTKDPIGIQYYLNKQKVQCKPLPKWEDIGLPGEMPKIPLQCWGIYLWLMDWEYLADSSMNQKFWRTVTPSLGKVYQSLSYVSRRMSGRFFYEALNLKDSHILFL